MGDVHEKNSTTGEWGVRSSTQTTDSSGNPAGNVVGEVDLTGGQAGSNLYSPLLGALQTYAPIPSAVASPTTYTVDLSYFGSADIWVVALTDGTEDYNVAIQFSNDGQAANAHTPSVPVIATTGVNNSGQITKKDRFAHISVTQEGAAAKDSYHFYVAGREIA